jgi:phospho-N-acetylmuramoyl-pentapeptide-transferase
MGVTMGRAYSTRGWYYPVTIFAILATGNTVNLADGLDGQAGGTSFLAIAFFVVYAIKLGQTGASLTALALAAALVGFLRYNLKPARVIMGDTGSLALGGALAGLAIVTRSVLVLPIVGGVFVAEGLSDIIQVISSQLTHRRVFRMAPLHHHYELVGWSEEQIVTRFWLVGLGLAIVAWILSSL